MKRRLLLLILPFVVVLSSLLPLFPAPTVSADTASDADKFCKAAEAEWYNKPGDPANAHYESCVAGYSQAKRGGKLTETSYCSGSISISEPSACVTGWGGGKDGATTASPGATSVTDACLPYGGDKLTACQKAVTAECAGWVSSTSPVGLTACVYGAVQNSTGASNDCASKYKKGDGLTACDTGFKGAQTPATNNDQQLDCEGSFDNPLTWIICPIVNTMVSAITVVDNIITAQLNINADNIFSNGACTKQDDQACTSAAYFAAWQSFRNIALGFMAIAGLIILIAQALGFELLDAYMIRKTLPRLLVAAIGITLSWPLMHFMVSLSNDLGYGIRHLIYAPFDKLKDGTDLSFGSGIANIFFGGAAVGVGVLPIWIAAGGLGVLLSYVGTAALAVFIAIIVLILRQVAIILLIILSPIAIVAYILPNTHNIFRLWWDSFAKALMMFPLIAAFIASGRVFSAVAINNAGNTGGANAVLSGFIGFAAYFAPYFLIPLTFKFAGGAIRQIGGFVNDRSRGGFDGLRSFRKSQSKSRIARARNKGLYRSDFGQFTRPFATDKKTGARKRTSVGNILNTLGNYTLDADEVIPAKLGTTTLGGLLPEDRRGIPGFRRGGARDLARIDQSRRDQTGKAFQEIDPGYKAGRLLAGEYGYYAGGLSVQDRKELDDNFGIKDHQGNILGYRAPTGYGETKQIGELFSRSTDKEGQEAGAELLGKAPLIEKYWSDPETSRVDTRLMGYMAAAKDGRLEIDDVVNNHNRMRTSGISPEQAINETTMLQGLLAQKRTSAARGHGIEYDENGRAYNVYKASEKRTATGEIERDAAGNAIMRGGPMSDKAQNSAARVTTADLSQVKSEDIDAWTETLVAGASEFEMEMGDKINPNTHEPMVRFKGEGADKNSLVEKTGQAAARAQEMRNRIKYLAQYNQGDSDVGVKLRNIWDRIGGDMSELEWGSGRAGSVQDPANPVGRPVDQGQDQGGPGQGGPGPS